MDEFLEQFLVEARELVEQGTAELLALERAPTNRDSLDGVFRTFHTLKGGAGIVDFAAMARAMHAAEDILADVRAGHRAIGAALIGDCLRCLDQVVLWLDAIDEKGDLPDNGDVEAESVIQLFSAPAPFPAEAPSAAAGWSDEPLVALALEEQIQLLGIPGAGVEGRLAAAGRVAVNALLFARRPDLAEPLRGVLSQALAQGDPAPLAVAIRQASRLLAEAPTPDAGVAAVRAEPLSRTLRVDAEQVNQLVKLTGELTVAKNAFGHIAKRASQEAPALSGAMKLEQARLERLVGALQGAVLELRVLPLRGVFQRFSRLVREISETLAKPVRFEIVGDDTQVDKAIIEMLFEPLLHVIRNAMDHGVESAAERAAAGKSSIAELTLRARREDEHVVIEVEDDGRGVDPARIREVAIQRGVASADTLTAMSGREIVDLIFAPGFSTAAEVSGLSGRGVGMDAVRAAVERIGGRVLVETDVGAGTLIRFLLPFSVMLTRVLTVDAGGQTFGVPLDSVVETLLAPRDQIHAVGLARALVFRGRAIPLIELSAALGSEATVPSAEATIIVVTASGQMWGLEAERLGERMEVILSPPEGLITNMPAVAGTTMLGDGAVLLVLNLPELLR